MEFFRSLHQRFEVFNFELCIFAKLNKLLDYFLNNIERFTPPSGGWGAEK